MIFELTTFCILVLLMIDFEAANAALTCNVASTLKKFVPNKKGAIEAISGLTILTGMDGGNADNIFTQAGSKTKDEVATMCSGFKAPGNEYCVVSPNSFVLGASDSFALEKAGMKPQCLIINPNDKYVAITMTNVKGTIPGTAIEIALVSVEVSEKAGQPKYMGFKGTVGNEFAIPPTDGEKSAFLIKASADWSVRLEGAAYPATIIKHIFNKNSNPSSDFKIHAQLAMTNGMRICMRKNGYCIEPSVAAEINIKLSQSNKKMSYSFDADLTLGIPFNLVIKEGEAETIKNVCNYIKDGLKLTVGSSDLTKVMDFFCGNSKIKFKVHLGSSGAKFEASIGSLQAKLIQTQVVEGRKFKIIVTKSGKTLGSAWYRGCGLGAPFPSVGPIDDWCQAGQTCEYINPATGYRCTGKVAGDSSKICPSGEANHACYNSKAQTRDHTKCKWGDYCGKNPGIG